MTFKDWADREIAVRDFVSREALWREIHTAKSVSKVTLEKAYSGGKLSRWSKAVAISEYTGGVVTVKELCE